MGMVNKTLRLQKLNELLKHNDGYTIIDLQVLLDVEERTVRKDLTLIQSEPYNAKLVTDLYRGRMRVYKYQDTNYDLPYIVSATSRSPSQKHTLRPNSQRLLSCISLKRVLISLKLVQVTMRVSMYIAMESIEPMVHFTFL